MSGKYNEQNFKFINFILRNYHFNQWKPLAIIRSLSFTVWKLEVTCDTLHVTSDTWHMTGVIWQTQGSANWFLKLQLISSSSFRVNCLRNILYNFFSVWRCAGTIFVYLKNTILIVLIGYIYHCLLSLFIVTLNELLYLSWMVYDSKKKWRFGKVRALHCAGTYCKIAHNPKFRWIWIKMFCPCS